MKQFRLNRLNIIQHEDPLGMPRALMAIVHEDQSAKLAAAILHG